MNTINDGQDPTHYGLGDTNSPIFDVGKTSRTKKEGSKGNKYDIHKPWRCVIVWISVGHKYGSNLYNQT